MGDIFITGGAVTIITDKAPIFRGSTPPGDVIPPDPLNPGVGTSPDQHAQVPVYMDTLPASATLGNYLQSADVPDFPSLGYLRNNRAIGEPPNTGGSTVDSATVQSWNDQLHQNGGDSVLAIHDIEWSQLDALTGNLNQFLPQMVQYLQDHKNRYPKQPQCVYGSMPLNSAVLSGSDPASQSAVASKNAQLIMSGAPALVDFGMVICQLYSGNMADISGGLQKTFDFFAGLITAWPPPAKRVLLFFSPVLIDTAKKMTVKQWQQVLGWGKGIIAAGRAYAPVIYFGAEPDQIGYVKSVEAPYLNEIPNYFPGVKAVPT